MKFQATSFPQIAGAVVSVLLLCAIGCLGDNVVPRYQLVKIVGGGNRDLYIKCKSDWHCVGTFDSRAATVFQYAPVPGRTNYGTLKDVRSNLCLNIWGGTRDANLYYCNEPASNNMIWEAAEVEDDFGQVIGGFIRPLSSASGNLWWTGNGKQMEVVDTCSLLAWQCDWVMQEA